MGMRRHLGNVQRVRGLAANLAQGNPVAHVHGGATLEVRQGEGCPSVAAIGGAQDREQCLVLIDGQKLPVAKSPTFGRKIPTDNFYFGQKWLCHILISSSTPSFSAQVCDGKTPKSENMKLTARNGAMLSCGCEPPARPRACE